MTSPLDHIYSLIEGAPKDYQEEILAYSANLNRQGLPILFSKEHLAFSIGIRPSLINEIISYNQNKYSGYRIRKKSGGTRWILAPEPDLKYIQTWIKVNILDKVAVHPQATGFISKRSIVTNASYHTKSEVILNIDFYRFFDSINERRVYGLFNRLGYAKNLSYTFAQLLCTEPPEKYFEEIEKEGVIAFDPTIFHHFILPQGSPASPTITNIICYRLDCRLHSLAQKNGCKYSRYVDDVTFSGSREQLPSLNTIIKIVAEEGFTVNKNKIKYRSKNKRQSVTGLIVNEGIRVPREYKKEIDNHLFYCLKFGPKNHLEFLKKKDIPIKSNYKQWLFGKILYLFSVEPAKAKKQFDQFQQIKWDL